MVCGRYPDRDHQRECMLSFMRAMPDVETHLGLLDDEQIFMCKEVPE